MKDNHVWRPGERVVSLLYGSKYCGKPAILIKLAYAYDFTDKGTYFKLETEDTREAFFAPVIAIESLENRQEEQYSPSDNTRLREQCPELFDENGEVIEGEWNNYGY